jgi:hypothetical protein
MRDHIVGLARLLWKYARQIPGPMPPTVAAAFARFGLTGFRP